MKVTTQASSLTRSTHLRALLALAASLHIFSLPRTVYAGYAKQRWPDIPGNELESVWLEGNTVVGYDRVQGPDLQTTLFTFLKQCPYTPADERNNAAEWLRFAYHDMATHNVNGDGQGGLDGSLKYELERPENVGHGMLRTMSELSTATSKHITFSDLIALGVVHATVSCNGPLIPYRSGRVDATTAGPAGVPEPHQSLEEFRESFRKQGFNATEMIELVACGHTLGGVRRPDFPEIVPPVEGADPEETRVVGFDSTGAFDTSVVTEDLDGTTQNPLVVHENSTITSDLRVFSSDGNKTVQSLADPETFDARCSHLLERMINTVPRGVTLGKPFEPIKVKVGRSFLTFNGEFGLQTDIRFLTKNPNRQVTLKYQSRDGGRLHGNVESVAPLWMTETTSPVAERLGHDTIVHYWFNPPINATTSISKFWFEVDEGPGTGSGRRADVYDNDGKGYEVGQDTLVFAPGLGAKVFFPKTGTRLAVAVRNTLGRVESVTGTCTFYDAIYNVVTDIPSTVTFTKDPSSPSSSSGFDVYSVVVHDDPVFIKRIHCDVTASIVRTSGGGKGRRISMELKDISDVYVTNFELPEWR